MKKKIVVDLDVLTITFSKRNDKRKSNAENFIEDIKKGEFEISTPYALIKLVTRWKIGEIRKNIIEFYETYSKNIISTKQFYDKTLEKGADIRELYKEFITLNIKREDVLLIIFTSIFELDEIVTFNRKHLKNNEEKINHILRNHKLKPIKIVLPMELGSSFEPSQFSKKFFSHLFFYFMCNSFRFISHNIKLPWTYLYFLNVVKK